MTDTDETTQIKDTDMSIQIIPATATDKATHISDTGASLEVIPADPILWYCAPCRAHWNERQLVDGHCSLCWGEVTRVIKGTDVNT